MAYDLTDPLVYKVGAIYRVSAESISLVSTFERVDEGSEYPSYILTEEEMYRALGQTIYEHVQRGSTLLDISFTIENIEPEDERRTKIQLVFRREE
jgi:hypothetical protein